MEEESIDQILWSLPLILCPPSPRRFPKPPWIPTSSLGPTGAPPPIPFMVGAAACLLPSHISTSPLSLPLLLFLPFYATASLLSGPLFFSGEPSPPPFLAIWQRPPVKPSLPPQPSKPSLAFFSFHHCPPSSPHILWCNVILTSVSSLPG